MQHSAYIAQTVADLRALFLLTTCSQACFSVRGLEPWTGLDAKSALRTALKRFKLCLETLEYERALSIPTDSLLR